MNGYGRGAGVAALLLLAQGCGTREVSGPPDLRLGRDECAECGMLVSDDRCASALLVEQDGRRSHLIFDDIGCMLDYEPNHAGLNVVSRFVRDYASKEWLAAESAMYVLAGPDKVRTPMSSGIVTYGRRPDAEQRGRECGGEVGSWETAREARRRVRVR